MTHATPDAEIAPLDAEQSTDSSQPATVTALPGLLAGLTYQTPVIGTIRIGGVTESGGQRLPFADDQFSVHTRYRDANGEWVQHAAQKKLEADPKNVYNGKLISIPVRIIYDNPNLNLGEQYAAFKKDGRPACVGNGIKAKRAVNGSVGNVACPGPAACQFGGQSENRCGTFARALFQIEGFSETEGAFIFRTGSYNSVNDMRVRLQSLHAGFGGKLAGLPMKLVMRLKSTAMSLNQPFYYVSLEPRFENFKDAMLTLREQEEEEKSCGFNRKAFEASMAQLLGNGSFSENVEDAGEYEDLIAARPSMAPLGGAPRSSTGNAIGESKTFGTGDVTASAFQSLDNLANMYGPAKKADAKEVTVTA